MHISSTFRKSISQTKSKTPEVLPELEFWFEFASSYSYLSTLRIEALSQKHSFKIIWKPFLLGPIFKSQGLHDSPFNIYKTKGEYMWKDMERLCQKRKIIFKKPDIFPQNGLLAARIAILGSDKEWIGDFTRKVFEANFSLGLNISEESTLIKILEDLKLNSSEIISQALTPENKEKLKSQTSQAKKFHIFGAPTFKIKEEIFWGDDRLDLAMDYLAD